MSTALQVIQIIFYIVGILFMLSFMFIGIWSFIIFLKMHKNQRINNYLLDKINKNISLLNSNRKEDSFDSIDFNIDDYTIDTNDVDVKSNNIDIEKS